ncbi:PepSY domain-containing protein [Paenibacillus sp. EC2-1]|uniref:PepSY domain-containing protein n=1 Tax=Paenibacillus sp. EC2-1 TaxID=3388665 RepID=UPI003BEF087F
MKQKLWIGTLGVVMLLGGTAVVGASGNTGSSNTLGAKAASQGYITMEQAKTAALKEVKGHVDDIDLERKQDKVYYEVEIDQDNGEVDVHIDAITGKVLAVLNKDAKDDDDDDRDDLNSSAAAVKITSDQASSIATKKVSGGKVVKVELDTDDNRYIYEVELRTSNGEADVDIDAVTGKVLSIDQDFDDHDE